VRSASFPTFILTLAAAASTAQAGITSNWIGRSGGAWSGGANWSSGVPGTAGVTDAIITTSRGAITVNYDGFYSISTLTISAGCTLNQGDNRDLTLTGLVNDGIWNLQSSGSATDINLNANVTFDGSGALVMSNHQNNRIISFGAERILTNGANHTIRGAAQLGFNNTGIVNSGLIEATEPAGLYIDVATSKTFDNNNLARAVNGSTLTFYGSAVDNVDGVVRAEEGSTVLIRFSNVTGGVIESTGTGQLSTTTEESTLIDVMLNGLLRMPDNADLALVGTFTNNGTLSMESTGSGTDLHLNSPIVTLTGPGELKMSNHQNNRIISLNAERTLVNSANHTIRGAAQLGFNNTGIVNNGLIEATEPAGLYVDVATSKTFENNNLARAINGSTLTFYGSAVDNVDGVVRAEDGSTVLIRFSNVTGGVMESTGTGQLSTTAEESTLIDVTMNGLLRMPDNADLALVGTFTNNGTLSMESTGSGTDLHLNSETVTLQGPGELKMSSHQNNRIFSVGTERTLVNAFGHTIRGAAQLGFNNTGIVNNGLIEASEPAGLHIDVSTSKTFENNNLARAVNGSTLTIYGSSVDNTKGVIRAEAESAVQIRSSNVTGGVIESTGTGQLTTTAEESTLIDVTMNGLLRMPDNADLALVGTFTNNGTLSMESAGGGTDLHLNSPIVTLTGPGELKMSSHQNNRIFSVGAERTLVNAFGHTIRGGAQLGFNNTIIQNKGLIEADVASGMTIDATNGGDSFNEGTIRVSGSGSLTLATGNFENRGVVDIDPTRTLTRNGSYSQTDGETRVDGTLTISGGSYNQTGGLLSGDGQVTGSVSMQGGSTSPSNVDGSDLGSLLVTGTYAQGNDGGYVVDLGLAGNDHLQVNGAATLGGALQVRLVGAFVPLAGQEFTIMNAASINGVFGCVEFPNAPAGYFTVVYGPTSVKLVVSNIPPQESDLDFDGMVGASDLSVLLGAWGDDPCNNAICCPADLNGDGKVNGTDLAILLGDWG
jgi:hypothetical protein